MKHIDEFTIHSFRGLRDLKLEGLGQINLLVGDNNSGKTSVLEALFLFCDSLNERRWSNVASMRETTVSSLSMSERLTWLFPQGEDYSDDSSPSITAEILLSASGQCPVEKVSASYEMFTETIQVRYPRSVDGESNFEDRDREVESIKIHVSSSIHQIQPTLFNTDEVLKETFIFPNNRPLSRARKREYAVLPAQIVNPSSHRLRSTRKNHGRKSSNRCIYTA